MHLYFVIHSKQYMKIIMVNKQEFKKCTQSIFNLPAVSMATRIKFIIFLPKN